MDDLVADFACEAAESLGGLQAGLARLAADRADSSAAAEMLRRLHGLKGVCGFVGFSRAEALAHAGENLLAAIAAVPAGVSSATLAPVGSLIERLGELLVGAAEMRGEPEGDDAELIARMAMTATVLSAHAGPSIQPTSSLGIDLQELLQAAGVTPDRRIRAPWSGLDTLARSLGDRLGKRIELMVGGDDLRIAAKATPALRTALIALVRNACDHGVETPAERRQAAKPARALLRLSVHYVADGASIEFSDDGRGIDPARIRQGCLEAGRLDAAAAAALADDEALELVFAPGVTTAEAVTALSGRGLGLEVVRSEVEGLGGRVELSSTPGHGVRFVISLPASALATPAARSRAAA
jgi:two-component system chemotaxis sensor kinase CheA